MQPYQYPPLSWLRAARRATCDWWPLVWRKTAAARLRVYEEYTEIYRNQMHLRDKEIRRLQNLNDEVIRDAKKDVAFERKEAKSARERIAELEGQLAEACKTWQAEFDRRQEASHRRSAQEVVEQRRALQGELEDERIKKLNAEASRDDANARAEQAIAAARDSEAARAAACARSAELAELRDRLLMERDEARAKLAEAEGRMVKLVNGVIKLAEAA